MSNTPPREDTGTNRAVRARAGESPKSVDMPFWVDACLALDPPRKTNGAVRSGRYCLYPVVRALLADRIDARGDEAVQLDRVALARWAGQGHPRNCGWIVAYLERIGFLEVHRRPSKTGQQPDTFDVFVEPPDNYVGPTSYAELDVALRDGGPRSLFSANSQNRRAKPNSACTEAGLNPSSASAELGPENRRAKPNSASTEAGLNPSSASAELGPENRRAKPNSASTEAGGSSLNEVNSFLPEGRKEGINEGDGVAPQGAAGDAAPEDDELTTAVRDLVRRLPWSKAPVGRTARVLADANARLVPAIVTAIREHEFPLAAAREHALARISHVRSVDYLVNAFAPERLSLPEPADALDLPISEPHETGAQQPGHQIEAGGGQELPPWCGECGDGDERAEICLPLRRVKDDSNTVVPCACTQPGWQNAA